MLLSSFHSVKAQAQTITVPDSYPTIQEAIDAANDGDTIYVKSGRYRENIVVNKAASLIGENKETTIIDGCGVDDAVEVKADNVSITGFTIENNRGQPFRNGIELAQVENCNVSGNKISNCFFGVALYFCSDCWIVENSITDTQYCIGGDYCSNCSITGNTVEYSYLGIGPDDSSNMKIIGNTITNVQFGIGIHFPSEGNVIAENEIAYNGFGIWIYFSYGDNVTGNSIISNNIADNGCGIWLYSPVNTDIIGNKIANNGHGIAISDSSNNSIFNNSFQTNHIQVELGSSYGDCWDDSYPSGGNYWSDYGGTDFYKGLHQNETGGDGIGDTGYVIDQNVVDHYPLMKPYPQLHDIVVKVRASRATVLQGDNTTVTIDVFVMNYGEQTENFNFTYQLNTTTYEQILSLTKRDSIVLSFIWDTTGLPKGSSYTVYGFAAPVLGETDASDNAFMSRSVVVWVDANDDGNVNVLDLIITANALGAGQNDPNWNSNADANGDSVVNVLDLILIAGYLGT
jgi:parallel beta-helix repeat protein